MFVRNISKKAEWPAHAQQEALASRRPWHARTSRERAQRGRALGADGLRDAAPRSHLRLPGPGVRPVPPAASPLLRPPWPLQAEKQEQPMSIASHKPQAYICDLW